MKTLDEHTEHLIGRYLSGEASREEQEKLHQWVMASEANKMAFIEYQKVWKGMGLKGLDSWIDVDAEWDSFQQRRSLSELTSSPVRKGHTRYIWRISAAAASLLLMALIIWNSDLITRKTLSADTEPATFMLPDSTVVDLNAHSTLKVPRRFKKKVREVALSGEAFFQVESHQNRPFRITSQGAVLEVLGTSFNVSAYPEDDMVEVVVRTGKVALSSKNDPGQTIILESGSKGLFSKTDQSLSRSLNTDINYLSWKTRKLVFINESMESIVYSINKVYHSRIEITSEGLKSCRVTATFDRMTLDAVLRILETTLDLHIDHRDDRILLSGEGC
jgi:ferric-dicitrate binding protein FerR (iron transport regulator)